MHEVPRGRRLLRRPSILIAAALVAGTGLSMVPTTAALAFPSPPPPPSMCGTSTVAQFGPNVCVFTPTMSQSAIQTVLNNIADQQVPNQFGPQRYALMFEPGTYGSTADPLEFEVGYYTEVAGLGATPADTTIFGVADVFNQCFGPTPNTGCVASDNFWRSLFNLNLIPTTVNGPDGPVFSPPSPDTNAPQTNTYCLGANEFWATSQASPIRRVDMDAFLTLDDYCGDESFSSGGFIADSNLFGGVLNGTQQQFFVRNSSIDNTWTNAVWNQVFVGDTGTAVPAQNFGPTAGQYTTIAATPVSEEEPILYQDSSGNWNVETFTLQHGTSGPDWTGGADTGPSIPISHFFIANPSTPVLAIDAALAFGKDLILTPGVYDLAAPIVVSRPDTVVLGLGFATLVPQYGNAAMIVIPNQGVKISGLIFDAGPFNSPVLLSVGFPGRIGNSATDPDLIQDTFFRVGGAESPAHATVSFLDNANNSIIDDVWAWRADHGTTANSTGWTVNTGDTGLVVTGDNVTAYGLFVEHYQRNEVIWSGQNGADYFFQNENPYDPPSQTAWMATPTQDGYPSFLVTNNVTSFQGYGMGAYSFFNIPGITPPIQSSEAFEAPVTPGVQFHDLLTIFLSKAGFGGIDSVINGVGESSTIANPDTPVDVVSYS